jgi:hypothetical protein
MYQQLWGYKVEEKLYLGVREQKGLNTTGLDSPTWALVFLRSFCQLKYPVIASSDSVTRVFSRVGLSAPRPTPSYPGGPKFSVRVVSLSWLVPILSVRISPFAFAWLSRINVAQEPWRGHACNGLGRNKWHYWSFVSIHLSARCVPSRPRTTPSTPGCFITKRKADWTTFNKCVA